MSRQPTTTTPPQARILNSRRSPRTLARIALAAGILTLAIASGANAGTYVISNCPSAPGGNGDPGPWTVFGAPQNTKGSCTGGPGNWIGPEGGSMSPGGLDGVQVTAPSGSGITIREAKVWWLVPHQISGADTFAVASVNTGLVEEANTPKDSSSTPDAWVLPSTTTELTLADYCSNDDAGNGCAFGGGENPNLELLGSQLTLADSNLPSGTVTGGALAVTGTLSGTQSLAYSAQDADSGVRLVGLLIDGQPAASNDYSSSCPYTDFQACPASESDTISWNTASVADGGHSLELSVEDAAQNTSVVYDGTITTENAPANTAAPTVLAPSQVFVGAVLSTHPGAWSAPTGAGSIAYGYQWETCDGQGNNCTAVAGAQSASYAPAPGDVGRTLRLLVNASDSDGQASASSAPTGVVLASQGSLGALPGPGTGGTLGASSTAGGGAPNGTPASASAQLRLGVQGAITRTFAHRAFRLTGRLLDAQGDPIGGATLEITQQIVGSSQTRVIAHAGTRSDGTFAVGVPAGPSRQVEVAYRALTGDASYAAQAKIEESVGAGVRLNITPLRTSPNGTIILTGTVQGPIPNQGTIVDLLVHYRGRWEPFRTPRTDAHGRFRVIYQFEGGVGRFPFRADAPAGQAGFPFAGGHSQVVDVATS
jgi:hypothetical protein